MKARKHLRIPHAKWLKHAPPHRRSLASNPNWWVCVTRLVKEGQRVEVAMAMVESRFDGDKGEKSNG